MHPLYGALPVPYVTVWVTRGALVAHLYTYVPTRCTTSQYSSTFIPLTVSLWNDLADPVFDQLCDWQISIEAPMLFIGLSCSLNFCLLLFSFSLLSSYWLVLCCRCLLIDI